MDKQIGIVSLDIGYSNIEDDLNIALVYKDNGDQDFSKTLNNYIELLKGAVASLELIKDTTNEKESENLELITNKNSTALCIKGNNEIIERYIGFGIANDNVVLGLAAKGRRRTHHDAATRQALADVVVTFAFEHEVHALGKERAEALASGTMQTNRQRVIR